MTLMGYLLLLDELEGSVCVPRANDDNDAALRPVEETADESNHTMT
jgi:hypothetical protein